jgi:hypothetical protein
MPNLRPKMRIGPTTCENALDWRVRCRVALAKRNRPTPKGGDTIIFAKIITFTDGTEARRLIISFDGRSTVFTNPLSGRRYRISRWKDRDWAVVPKIDVTSAAG